jgi:outer membrane protein TolC
VNIVNAQLSVNPGAFYNMLQSTRSARGAAQSALDKVRADIQKGTIDLYYRVVLAQETVDLQQKALEALGENVRVVTAGYEKGLFSKLDYLSAKVEYSNQQTELQRAQNALLSARAAFNIHLGRGINEAVVPDFDPARFDRDELGRYVGEAVMRMHSCGA